MRKGNIGMITKRDIYVIKYNTNFIFYRVMKFSRKFYEPYRASA